VTTNPHLTLHFVRHGETDDNAVRRFQMPEAALSDRGREQARAAALALRESTSAGAIIASDYARTIETATIIAQVLGLDVVPEPALRERHFGDARGRLYSDLGDDIIASWRDPFVRVPGGESWADVHQRIAAFLDGLRARAPHRELILVTHGGAMSIALAVLSSLPIGEFVLTPLENCAIRTVHVEVGKMR
jgi:broad specificity phosphatase PhoE